MAGTTITARDHTVYVGSPQRHVVIEYNKLVDDAETIRGAASESVVAVTELMADHATFKTAVDQTETLVEELHDDHATFKSVVDDLKARLNQMYRLTNYAVLGNPTFAIDTNFDVKSTEPISYLNGGTLKTLADNANFDTGTAATIATVKWGAAVLSVNSGGTGVVTWAAGAPATYASEAAAIAALTDPGATDTVMGYVTVLAAGSTWTAGTDALTGGTGGTPATTTNYYNAINPNSLLLGAAVSTSAPATLTAAKPASAPATLSASVPSATAINAATDLTAAKIADSTGTVLTT